jgi:hypothetical protein
MENNANSKNISMSVSPNKITLPRAPIFLIIIQFFIFGPAFSQIGAFQSGFKDGYKKGYCFEKINCVSPPPPVAPIPKPGESGLSYQDGYNRGFKMGLDANKAANSTKEGDKLSQSDTAIDYMYKPTELETKVASKAPQNFETGMKRARELYNEGRYSDCIDFCKLINRLTNLVSYDYYNLISLSYYKLGDSKNGKKFEKKADKEFLRYNKTK